MFLTSRSQAEPGNESRWRSLEDKEYYSRERLQKNFVVFVALWQILVPALPGHERGRVNPKTHFPGAGSTHIFPLWASTILLALLRPSPVPLTLPGI